MNLEISNPLWLIIGASLIALMPICIGLFTSYIKVSVVLGMLRSGIGTQQVPSSMTVMVLSLSITAFVMAPVVNKTILLASNIRSPNLSNPPTSADYTILKNLFVPWQEFIEKHAGDREVQALTLIAGVDSNKLTAPNAGIMNDRDSTDTPLNILIPAFVLTELRQGFSMGFVLLLPFLAIDLIVGNVLAGLGMTMLSPTIVSLPIKLILFVVADGWLLLTKGLIESYS